MEFKKYNLRLQNTRDVFYLEKNKSPTGMHHTGSQSGDATTKCFSPESKCLNFQISKYPNIQISQNPGIRISKYPDIQISKYPEIQIPRQGYTGMMFLSFQCGLLVTCGSIHLHRHNHNTLQQACQQQRAAYQDGCQDVPCAVEASLQ